MAKAQEAQKNGELAANQRDALQAQLTEVRTKAQQADKNAELAASQRDALQAQLKDAEARSQQAQKDAALAVKNIENGIHRFELGSPVLYEPQRPGLLGQPLF